MSEMLFSESPTTSLPLPQPAPPPLFYLIPCWHDCNHWKLINFNLCNTYSCQKTNLWGAHVGSFGQNAFPSFNVMANGSEKSKQNHKQHDSEQYFLNSEENFSVRERERSRGKRVNEAWNRVLKRRDFKLYAFLIKKI